MEQKLCQNLELEKKRVVQNIHWQQTCFCVNYDDFSDPLLESLHI